MERHILVDCKKVKTEVRAVVRYIVKAHEKSPENVTEKEQNANEDQKTLEEFYDDQTLFKEKKDKIEIALIKLFVCCGISWHLVEHSFFIEFVKELRSSFNLPNRKTLVSSFLDDEILRVNTKIY